MRYRYLGNSGLKISEITYGNWLTHGSQVGNEVATEVRDCFRTIVPKVEFLGIGWR